MDYIAYDGKVVFNIKELKSIKIISDDKPNIKDRHYFLTFELKSRIEYVFNPNENKYVKEIFNDTIQIEFKDYGMAEAYRNDWIAMWEQYIEEKNELNLEE